MVRSRHIGLIIFELLYTQAVIRASSDPKLPAPSENIRAMKCLSKMIHPSYDPKPPSRGDKIRAIIDASYDARGI